MRRPLFAVGSEAWICKEIMNWARLNDTRWPWLQRLIHISNEGKRNPIMAKAIGIRSGVSDYFCPAPSKGLPSLWLEVKTEKNKPTESQVAWKFEMIMCGDVAEIGYGLSDCLRILHAWCVEIERECKRRTV